MHAVYNITQIPWPYDRIEMLEILNIVHLWATLSVTSTTSINMMENVCH